MGVTITPSTMPNSWTPICNDCGIALCYDISDDEYQRMKNFWENWRCKECNEDWKGARRRYEEQLEMDEALYSGR